MVQKCFSFNEFGPFRLAEEQRLAAKLGLPLPQVHCRAGGAACQTAMPGKSVACCPGYPNAHGRAATGPILPRIPPGCVGLAGSCSGGAARQRRPRFTPRLISCHPSGMALGRRLDCSRPAWTASRRDAGILAGGRGRVFCGRHPRKPSPKKLTRTPAGARGKPPGIERAATGCEALAGPRPAFIGTH